MVNLAKTLNKYIKDNISGVTIYNDNFPADNIEGVITIHDPSPRTVQEFINGVSIYQINISFTARYKNPATARKVLDDILTLLDKAKITDSTDNLALKITASANVQFVGTDDAENSIYTCSITVEYKTKK